MDAPKTDQPIGRKLVKRLCTQCDRRIEVFDGDVECIVCEGALTDIPPEKKAPKLKQQRVVPNNRVPRFFDPSLLSKRELALRRHFRQMIDNAKPGAAREALVSEFIRRFLKE